MLQLPWKGNVRELQNLIECIVHLYPEQEITPEQILENIDPIDQLSAIQTYVPSRKRRLLTEEEIRRAIAFCNGNKTDAAMHLGITRKTLYRNMERLGMDLNS